MLPGHRPRPLLLLAAAAAAVLACDDAQPPFQLADQVAQAFCARQFDCCSPLEISVLTSDRYTTQDGCIAFATLSAREQLGTVEGSIAQGRITLDAGRAAECVAAYRDRACATSPQLAQPPSALPDLGEVLALCPDLLVGHVGNGRACNLSQECLRGSHCAAGSPIVNGGFAGTFGGGFGGMSGTSLGANPGVCVPYQRQGEPCNSSADCDPTTVLTCNVPAYVCGPPPQEGQMCAGQIDPLTGSVSTSDCDPTKHLFCDAFGTSVCRRFPTAGQPCNFNSFPQCDPDPALALSCNQFTGVCNKPGNEGDACGALAIAPCRADLACRPTQSDGIGACGSPPGVGDRCYDRCATPAVCDGGYCLMPGAASVGTPCHTSTDCASLLCAGFTAGTLVCSPPIISPICAGAGITPGFPPGITGMGGTFGTGTGGFGGGGPAGRPPPPTGTAGAGGSGGGPLGCLFSNLPVDDPFIANFDTEGGIPPIPIGGTFTYPGTGGAPVIAFTGNAMHVTAMTTGMMVPQYWGVGIYFNNDPTGLGCVDATAHSGVQFDVWGSVGGTGCTLQYATNDSAHTDNAVDPHGAGDSMSYAPQAPFTVTSTPATLMMPFVGTGAPTGGNPAISVDKSKLTGVLWQFTTAAGLDQSCVVDINIDNVRFF